MVESLADTGQRKIKGFNCDFNQLQHQPMSSVSGSLGSSSWNLSNKMSFLTTPKLSFDEASNYISLSLIKDEIEMLRGDGCFIAFWLTERHSFPRLHLVAIRRLITFPSSAPSERDFSALKLAVS